MHDGETRNKARIKRSSTTPFQGTTSCDIEIWQSSSSSEDKAKSLNAFKSFTSEITCKSMGFGNLDPQHGHQM